MVSQKCALALILKLLLYYALPSMISAAPPVIVATMAKQAVKSGIGMVQKKIFDKAKAKMAALKDKKVVYLLLPVMGNALTVDQLPAINVGGDGNGVDSGNTGGDSVGLDTNHDSASIGVNTSNVSTSAGVDTGHGSTGNLTSVDPKSISTNTTNA
jgi:hypothetical protein